MKKTILLGCILLFSLSGSAQEYKKVEGENPRRGLTVKTTQPPASFNRRAAPARPVATCEVDLDDFINESNQWILDNQVACDEITFLIDYTDREDFLKNAEVCKLAEWPEQRWDQYRDILIDTEKKLTEQGKKVQFAVLDKKKKKYILDADPVFLKNR